MTKPETHPILSPLSVEHFLKDYWEVKPLHIDRSDSSQFEELLSMQDIEALLTTQDLFYPSVQLTRHGQSPNVSEYVDDEQRIEAMRLIQLHNEGATLVISQAQRLLPRLQRCCHELTSLMSMRCQTNIYLTPARSQGFAAHYDTHDVLLLQVSGSKTFNLYGDGVDLPFVDDNFDRSAIGSLLLAQTVHLQQGDTLYIPRGVVHDAVSQEQSSLHITLGLFPMLARDYLQELIQVVSERDRRFRQTVFPDKDPGRAEELLAMLTGHMRDPSVQAEVNYRHWEQLSTPLKTDVTGLLSQHSDLADLCPDSPLQLKEQEILAKRRTAESMVLFCIGRVLEFEEPFASAVETMVSMQRFQPRELTGLSKGQQLALCTRLVRENIVRFCLLDADINP